MSGTRAKNLRVLAGAGAMFAVMTGLVVYSPTLYRMFCSLTGYGGTVQQRTAAIGHAEAATGRTVKVLFDANVAPGLPWDFRPEERSVEAKLGEPTKTYYVAHNRSDQTIVARATFNVTPYKVAPYFFKIECFCFTEEKLGPGESARMPLVLYVDEQLDKDPDTTEVRDITLSYTFFRQSDSSPEAIAAARDLKAGSQETDARLEQEATATFENDAPRQ